MTEQWRPVLGYEGYEVSDAGRVYSIRSGRILSNCRANGYWRVYLATGCEGEHRTRPEYVHTLVLEAFTGKRPDGMQCCHENGDRTDARAVNLRWGTFSDNTADKERHGRTPRGNLPRQRKLNERQVREIRACVGNANEIAAMYGVSNTIVRRIRRRLDWAWLV